MFPLRPLCALAVRYMALSLSFVALNLGIVIVDTGRFPRSVSSLHELWFDANGSAIAAYGVLLVVTPALVLFLDWTIDHLIAEA